MAFPAHGFCTTYATPEVVALSRQRLLRILLICHDPPASAVKAHLWLVLVKVLACSTMLAPAVVELLLRSACNPLN